MSSVSIRRALCAILLLASVLPPSASAATAEHYGLVGFLDQIHDSGIAVQDTHWSIPMVDKNPANPCSFRFQIKGRQKVSFSAPGQFGRDGYTKNFAIRRNGTVSPSVIDAPAQVERKLEMIGHLEDIAPSCDQNRLGGPGIPRTEQVTQVPDCHTVLGTLHIHLRFVNNLHALRMFGTFQPYGGDLKEMFGHCNLDMLPDTFKEEKDGGMGQHDWPVHRYPLFACHDHPAECSPSYTWWNKNPFDIWATDQWVKHDQDFFKPGSRASTVLAMDVQFQRTPSWLVR